jgi:hypothetical protein
MRTIETLPDTIIPQARVYLQASHNYPVKIRTLEILGPDGLLRLDYQDQTLVFDNTHTRDWILDGTRYEEPLKRMWRAILKGEPTATVRDGIENLRLALQLQGEGSAPTAPALALAA